MNKNELLKLMEQTLVDLRDLRRDMNGPAAKVEMTLAIEKMERARTILVDHMNSPADAEGAAK